LAQAQRAQAQCAQAQRALARQQKRAKNRAKARRKGARAHRRRAAQRADGLHTLTTRLLRENQVICAESRTVTNLVRPHALAQAISAVGWGERVRQRQYTAGWYGRPGGALDQGDPRSKRGAACGHILDSLDRATRQWPCPACGARHDRDINAARHVLAAGLAVNAGGEAVRPGRATPDSARPAAAGIPQL
jgi:putative transposase